jgi:hypothetical protein
MKTTTVNAYVVISMIISLLAFYANLLPEGTNPKIILWMGGISSGLSLFLKYFFPSGTWIGSSWSNTFWIVNVAAFVGLLLPVWGNMGLMSASLVTAIIGTINIILTAFGVNKPSDMGKYAS